VYCSAITVRGGIQSAKSPATAESALLVCRRWRRAVVGSSARRASDRASISLTTAFKSPRCPSRCLRSRRQRSCRRGLGCCDELLDQTETHERSNAGVIDDGFKPWFKSAPRFGPAGEQHHKPCIIVRGRRAMAPHHNISDSDGVVLPAVKPRCRT